MNTMNMNYPKSLFLNLHHKVGGTRNNAVEFLPEIVLRHSSH